MNYCGNCQYWRVMQRPDGIMTGDFRCKSPNGLVKNTMVGWHFPACDSFLDKSKVPATNGIFITGITPKGTPTIKVIV